MKRAFGLQLRVMLLDKKFVISFCLMLILALFFPLVDSLSSFGKDSYDLREAYMLFSAYDGFNYGASTYMALFVSLLSVFAFSDSFFLERKRGILPAVYTRCRPAVYFFTRELAVFLGVFLLVLAPLLINAGVYLLAFGTGGLQTRNGIDLIHNVSGSILPQYLFPSLFLQNPYLYYLAHVGLFSLFFALAAAAVCGVSFFLRRGRLVLLFSVFLLSVGMLLLQGVKTPVNLSYFAYLIAGYYMPPEKSGWILAGWFALLLLILAVSSILAGRRKDDLLR